MFIPEFTTGHCSVLGQSVLPLSMDKYRPPTPSFWEGRSWLLLLSNSICAQQLIFFFNTSETTVDAAKAWALIQSLIFLLLCMSNNFLLELDFVDCTWLNIWILLSSFKESWALYSRQVSFFYSVLILLRFLFKLW